MDSIINDLVGGKGDSSYKEEPFVPGSYNSSEGFIIRFDFINLYG